MLVSSAIIAWSLAFVNILYLVIAIGLFNIDAQYIRWLNIVVQSVVCAYLIYRFNPYIYRGFMHSRNDLYIIFWCAILIINNIIVNELANTQLAAAVQFMKTEPTNILKPVLDSIVSR